MSELARKLGIRAGDPVCLIGANEEAEAALRSELPEGVHLTRDLRERRFPTILFWPTELSGLTERFKELQACILPNGAVWAVMPKKAFAQARGIDFSWSQMQAAALQTDLVDNKEASFSAQEYATRFVIRKDRREKTSLGKG